MQRRIGGTHVGGSDIRIVGYDDYLHRDRVIQLWTTVFGYDAERNRPTLVIDKKLAMDDELLFVAVEDEQVLGTALVGYDGHRGWIYSMAVKPDRRGEGIGTQLLHHAEAELKRLGCVKINLQIMAENEEVRAFYERNGYSFEERVSMGKEISENLE